MPVNCVCQVQLVCSVSGIGTVAWYESEVHY